MDNGILVLGTDEASEILGDEDRGLIELGCEEGPVTLFGISEDGTLLCIIVGSDVGSDPEGGACLKVGNDVGIELGIIVAIAVGSELGSALGDNEDRKVGSEVGAVDTGTSLT